MEIAHRRKRGVRFQRAPREESERRCCYRPRVLLQKLHHLPDAHFQLRIMSFAYSLRITFHVDIGRNTLILHFPFALESIDGDPW
jgi:hypothetical protein